VRSTRFVTRRRAKRTVTQLLVPASGTSSLYLGETRLGARDPRLLSYLPDTEEGGMKQRTLIVQALAVIAMGGVVLLTPPGGQNLEASRPEVESCSGCAISYESPVLAGT
jgi:hypothetical protein